MAEVIVSNGTVRVRLQGADRLHSFRWRIDIPLAHVVTAETDPALGRSLTPGARPANALPATGRRIFRDVRDPEKAVAIELADDRYDLVVVDVEEPERTVEQIDAALRTARAA